MRSNEFVFCLLLVVFVIFAPIVCLGQNPSRLPPFPGQTAPKADPDQVRREHELARKLNQQRQAELKRDADNLLKLATELKQYVDQSNENTLSIDVIQKAEQIERLAHSVKDKMKGN